MATNTVPTLRFSGAAALPGFSLTGSLVLPGHTFCHAPRSVLGFAWGTVSFGNHRPLNGICWLSILRGFLGGLGLVHPARHHRQDLAVLQLVLGSDRQVAQGVQHLGVM